MAKTKHVLIVVDHPKPASLTHALAAHFAEGAKAAGHSTEICDLHAERFDPRWTITDIEDRATDILPYQDRIERCDALCLVFPLFWFGMPAMMKGWIDRVWTYGWAYDQTEDPTKSLLKDRIGVMLIPAGANPEHWAPYGFKEMMLKTWETGMMGYFGLCDRRVHLLNGANGSDLRRARLLEQAYNVGKWL